MPPPARAMLGARGAASLPRASEEGAMPARRVPRPFNLLWGSGKIIEEAAIEGGLHAPSIQLMRYEQGEKRGQLAIRFAAYDPQDDLERRPLIVNERELRPLQREIDRSPRLKALLRRLVEDDGADGE